MVPTNLTLLAVLALIAAGPDGKPLRAWVDVPSPKKVQAPPPLYPRLAAEAGISAYVIAEVTIDPEGRPSRVKVVFGHPLFDEEMERAIRNWSYEPTVVDGLARSVIVYEPYFFTLTQKALAQNIGWLAEQQRARSPWALEVKLWAVEALSRLLPMQRDAAVKALQKLAADADERVATRAKAALAALPVVAP